MREREGERDRDRDRERQREIEGRDRYRQRQRHTYREGKRDSQTHRDTDRLNTFTRMLNRLTVALG